MQTQALSLNFKQDLLDSRFELLSIIGRGRNSVVYKARIPEIDSQNFSSSIVALKLVNDDSRDTEQGEQRIRHEACSLLACRHVNVIELRDFVVSPELSYLVMQYAPDGDLKQLLDSSNILELNTAIDYSIQLLEGLEAIHSAGILHRDIKPENLLLRDGIVKIADFGIACLVSESISTENANRGIGTFDYLAPEVLEEGVSTFATDVYAAAVTIYQLITTHVPFSGTTFTEQINNKISARHIPLANLLHKELPVLESIISKALDSAPENRYGSARELRDALIDYQKRGEASSIAFVSRTRKRVVNRDEEPLEMDNGVDDLQINEKLDQPEIESDNGFYDIEKTQEPPIGPSNRFQNYLLPSHELEEGIKTSFYAGRNALLAITVFLAIGSILFSYLFFTSTPGKEGVLDRITQSSRAQNIPLRDYFSKPRAGVIENAFGDNKNVNFAISPVNEQYLLVALGLAGMEPVIVPIDAFLAAKKVSLSTNGLKYELALSADDFVQAQLEGQFLNEGSEGSKRFTLW